MALYAAQQRVGARDRLSALDVDHVELFFDPLRTVTVTPCDRTVLSGLGPRLRGEGSS
ncbi:hypothetical protein [Streptomyces hydrogenans]|uniref:hypothetical protein n=1 Tax=Streptomyces hydrogenans TaxID=1873719 RepID=UPI0038047F86